MSYQDVFTGSPVQPADVSYRAVNLTADQTLQWSTGTPNTGTALARIMDVTPDAGGWVVTLPVGTGGPTGADALFRNLGAFSFDVRDSTGVPVVTIAATQSVYVYLSDNSTAAGVWESVLFGAGSSQLSAASVASPSVIALAGTLNQAYPITTLSSNYTVVAGDRGTAFVWTGGAGTLSLTAASTLGDNHFFMVRNSGAGALTIDPSNTEQIDGNATIAINPTESAIILCSGAAFYTVGLGRSVTFAYTKLTKSVAGSSNVTLSATEYANGVMEFTGLLTGNIEVIFPTTINVYYIKNSTTGAYTLTCKTASGTGVSVIQSTQSILFCDGTNLVLPQTGAGAGTVTSVASGTGLTGGPIITTGTISIANTGVTAGTYALLGGTVNAQGQLTGTDEATTRNAGRWYF